MERKKPKIEDWVRSQHARAIGARLRRLSERIDRDATQVYVQMGISFEQRWVGVLRLLSLYGPLSVGELATGLGISHVSVSQARQSLANGGYISWEPDPLDRRSRKLRLSPDGQALVDQVAPIWKSMEDVSCEINAEAEDAMAALERLDRILDESSLFDRVMSRLR